MRRREAMAMLILMFLTILTGCVREEVKTEENTYISLEDLNRPQYSSDSKLFIGLETETGNDLNPFLPLTHGEKLVLSRIFTTPLISNMDNELIPWNGNMLTSANADGSISYTLTLDKYQKFTDGTPITIDDYLYSLYVKADPSYEGPDPLTELDIRGLGSYYYDDENWKENLEKLNEYALSRYSLENITQDDFTSYLEKTRLDGRFDEISIDEWKEILEKEGYVNEIGKAETDEDILELAALYEYGENMESHDPEAWYRENLIASYIESNLKGDEHVERISGIEKLNDYAARITLDSVTPETARILNTYIVPSHYYGPFEKGDITPVTEIDIPLGSGAYTFYAEYDDKIVLKANDLYREGIPNMETVVFVRMKEESIISALQIGAIDIGLLRGKDDNLTKLGHSDVKCDMISHGPYPSVFLNTRTLSENDRKNLHNIIRSTVKYLPLTALEKKVDAPLSPQIPEYPEYFRIKLDENLPFESRNEIRILIDDRIPRSNMAMLVRDLHSNIRLVGSTLVTEYLPEEEIRKEMLEGRADAAILISNGTLEEKASMYYSEGKDNIQGIADSQIDEILKHLMREYSLDERRKLSSMLMDIIEEDGYEVPLYQNRAIIAYNIDSLDMTSLPESSTSSWNVLSTLWSIRKN